MPRSLLLSLRGAPTCRRGGPRGSDRQAGRSGPPAPAAARTRKFPRKAGGRRQRGRPLRTPARAKGTDPSRGAAVRPARRGRSGAGAESGACGVSEPAGAADSAQAALLRAPAGSLRCLLQNRAISLRARAFLSPRSPGRGRGNPTEPESRGPVPAASQAGKLGVPARVVRTRERPRRALQGDARPRAPGPQRGAEGPIGGGGGLAPLPAPAYLRWPEPREDQVSERGRALSVAATRPRVLRSVSLAVGGSRARWRVSRLQLRQPPLPYHRRRGCPISAAGTGARDVTLRAPPAQSPPPVRAARPPAAQTRAGPAAGARSSRARTRGARTPSAPGRSLHPRGRGCAPPLALVKLAGDNPLPPPTPPRFLSGSFPGRVPQPVL